MKKSIKITAFFLTVVIAVCSLTGCNLHIHNPTVAGCTYASVCRICEKVIEKPLGHSFVPATCTAPSICTRCGLTNGVPLGHSYAEAPSCENQRLCNLCGYYEDTKGHTFSTVSCGQTPTCTSCGAVGTVVQHDYIPATCTTAQVCRLCGEIEGEPLNHSYYYASCESGGVCTRCNAQDHNPPRGHSYKDATCTAPKFCIYCGVTVGSPLAHTYVSSYCTGCGNQDPRTIPVSLSSLHVIDSDYFRTVSGFTDTYGNLHGTALEYKTQYWDPECYSVHNLNREYTVFSGSIVVGAGQTGNTTVRIYVDDVCVFQSPTITKETERINFSVNVTGASKMRISVPAVGGSHISWDRHVAVVDAKLTRK